MNEALRAELLAMRDADVALRSSLPARDAPDFAEAVRRMLETDARNTARLREMVNVHGWPGFALVGADGATAAWLVAQHADADRAFQTQCLELLREAVARDDADPQHLAFLTDRLRVAAGQPQLYGTQMRVLSDGRLKPFEIEDAEGVNERRAALGLGSLESYIETMLAKP